MTFNRFSNQTIATAYNHVTGNKIDRIDAIDIRDSLNAGWLQDQTEEIYDMCVVVEKRSKE
jgi:hypothetical protein